MRIADVINYLRFGSLREVSIAKNALCNQEALQVIVNAINMALIEINKRLCFRRDTITFAYYPDVERYAVGDLYARMPNGIPIEVPWGYQYDNTVEQIMAVWDSRGEYFKLNVRDSRPIKLRDEVLYPNYTPQFDEFPMNVQTIGHQTLRFPFKHPAQIMSVEVLLSISKYGSVQVIPDMSDQENGWGVDITQMIDVPDAFLEAIVAYVSMKIMQPVAPNVQGQTAMGATYFSVFEQAIQQLKLLGYDNTPEFNRDQAFRNSTYQ